MSAQTFEQFTSNPLDELEGSGEDVILGAYVADTARAIAENDLLPDGVYPVHTAPGEYRVGVQVKGKERNIIFQVFDYAEQMHKERLKELKETWAGLDNEGPIYDVPHWLLIKILLLNNAHPMIDEQQFEMVLAEHYPECWIKPDRMPRRLIL